MHIACRTEIGLVRTSNQDSLIISKDGVLFGVADGMGGHRGGNVASALAAQTLLSGTVGCIPSEKQLKQGIQEANRAVYTRQLTSQELSGMGTTVTVLWEREHDMILGHVGDSRAYLLRDGAIRQLSEDHSVIHEMIKQGVLTEEQAKVHPYRHMITRAVGTDPDVEPDILTVGKRPGDVWLICSDGLTEYVSDEEIGRELELTPEEAVNRLTDLALERGGRDNISVVVARDDK